MATSSARLHGRSPTVRQVKAHAPRDTLWHAATRVSPCVAPHTWHIGLRCRLRRWSRDVSAPARSVAFEISINVCAVCVSVCSSLLPTPQHTQSPPPNHGDRSRPGQAPSAFRLAGPKTCYGGAAAGESEAPLFGEVGWGKAHCTPASGGARRSATAANCISDNKLDGTNTKSL